MNRRWMLRRGDCVAVMKRLPANTVDAIVCDPPYGLAFMGKEFDSLGDGRAQQAWHLRWAREAFRVLKPGGMLLAYGGTRTYHRLACAIEDAGFEIRDSLSVHGWSFSHLDWTYGEGFPKSLSVSKSIDKRLGKKRRVVGSKRLAGNAAMPISDKGGTYSVGVGTAPAKDVPITVAGSKEAAAWEGWGSQLKPSHEPICLARKPLEGSVVDNVLKHGTGAINIDACRVPHTGDVDMNAVQRQQTDAAIDFGGASAGDVLPMYKPGGRWPANTLMIHHPNCSVVGLQHFRTGAPQETFGPGNANEVFGEFAEGFNQASRYGDDNGLEAAPVWDCVDGCPIRSMDEQTGVLKGRGNTKPSSGGGGMYGHGKIDVDWGASESGGASRFFNQFQYEPGEVPFLYHSKASRKEREDGCEGVNPLSGTGVGGSEASGKVHNNHPTVKPIGLMKWCVDLCVGGRKGAFIVDPFAGSGTTGIAALRSGVRVLLIEKDAHYCDIIRRRMEHEEDQQLQKKKKRGLDL